MKFILLTIFVVLMPSKTSATCIDAFKSETGVTLGSISDFERAIGRKIKLSPYPGGIGGIYYFESRISFLGNEPTLRLGFYLGDKISAVSLGFDAPLNADEFTKKYSLPVRKKTNLGTLLECEKDISLFIGKFKAGGVNTAMIKSIKEVDHLSSHLK